MSRTYKTGLWVIAAILALIVLGILLKRSWRDSAPEAPLESVMPPMPSVSALPSAQPSGLPAVGMTAASAKVDWDELSARFGEHLVAQFDRTGRLIAVRGKPGEGEGLRGFKSDDPQKAIARARQVIDAAKGLLGLNSDFPLGEPVVKNTPSSAQVSFRQTKDGVPLAPLGGVTVDLGSEGELLGLDSDYVPEVRIVNERKISADQARAAAVAVVADDQSVLKTAESGQVIWVTRPAPGQVAEGRNAYRFNAKGRDVIVDASSGAILHERDRRRY